jgi:hypothetical protein
MPRQIKESMRTAIITPMADPPMLHMRSVSDDDRVGRYTWISSIARLMIPEIVTVKAALRNGCPGRT